jgi:uncharacterized membrane protein YagU involved in acid resistance
MMMGMLPMVGMLIRVENAVVGFIVHMVISAFIGAVYGIVAGRFVFSAINALIGGVINGVVWWVLGALILMPLLLGMTQMVFAIGQAQWMSLLGHLISDWSHLLCPFLWQSEISQHVFLLPPQSGCCATCSALFCHERG